MNQAVLHLIEDQSLGFHTGAAVEALAASEHAEGPQAVGLLDRAATLIAHRKTAVIKEDLAVTPTTPPVKRAPRREKKTPASKKGGDRGLRATVLTKGATLADRDFRLVARHGFRFGQTVCFWDPRLSAEYEPHASSPQDRFTAARMAKEAGIPTWVSLEPVINLYQAVEVVQRFHPFIDEWRIGKWNHSPDARDINWLDVATVLRDVLRGFGANFTFKRDLAAYLEEPAP